MTVRSLLRGLVGAAALLPLSGAAVSHAAVSRGAVAPTIITVYKSPSCGCCRKWVDYMRAQGFQVVVHDLDDLTEVKTEAGVPAKLRSCHTALVGGYAIEGHVPADLVVKLLREHPKVAGLAVPGMVSGSPGMEGGAPVHYDVVAFDRAGHTLVYASR